MSAISEKHRAALYGKLNVSGVTTICNGVFHAIAPQIDTAGAQVDPPYVIFNRQGPAPLTLAFATSGSPTVVMEDELWLIKVVTKAGTTSPQSKAETILAACKTAIGSSLSLSGATNVACYWVQDIPEYQEQKGADETLYHYGILWRLASHA